MTVNQYDETQAIVASRPTLFISRAGEDREIASYIDKLLRDNGYDTFIQDNFKNTSFMDCMAQAFDGVEQGSMRVVGILSRHYQQKDHCQKEARFPLIDDDFNRKQRLILLRVDDCAPSDFLKDIPFTDISSVLSDATALKRVVLGAVDSDRNSEDASLASLYRYTPQHIVHRAIEPVAGFVTRADELAAIEKALWQTNESGSAALVNAGAPRIGGNSRAATTAVRGLGGVGKSVLAKEYAWRNRKRYGGVWWLRAGDQDVLIEDIISLGSRYIADLASMPDKEQAVRLTLDYIEREGTRPGALPWLFIYDNVETPAAIEKVTPRSGAHTLITTRWSGWFGQADEITIGGFELSDAVDFLLARARKSAIDPEGTRTAAERLAKDLGCLPLALSHARSHCRGANIDFDTYHEKLSRLLEKAPRNASYPDSVAATFNFALDSAAADDPTCEDLMSFVAFFAPDEIPLSVLPNELFDELALGDAISRLHEASLLEPVTLSDGGGGLSVHRLVQEVMRARLGDTAPKICDAVVKVIADAYPFGLDVELTNPVFSKLDSHALAAIEHARDLKIENLNTAHLMMAYALMQVMRGHYSKAQELGKCALAILDRDDSADSETKVSYRTMLAACFTKTDPKLACQILDEVIKQSEATQEASGEVPEMLASATGHRALLAIAMGEAKLAERLAEQSIRITEQSEHDPMVTIDALVALSQLYEQEGRFSEAEGVLRKSVDISSSSDGMPKMTSAKCRLQLGNFLRRTSRFSEAEQHLHQALTIADEWTGDESPLILEYLYSLSGLQTEIGQNETAISQLRRANEIALKFYSERHDEVARSYSDLALALSHEGQNSEAEMLLHKAIAIRENLHGPESAHLVALINNLAQEILQQKDDDANAQQLLRRALRIAQATDDQSKLVVARQKVNLAQSLLETDDTEEAWNIIQDALGIFDKHAAQTGHRHPNHIVAMQVAATCLEKQDRLADAESLIAMAIRHVAANNVGLSHFPQKYHSLLENHAHLLKELGRDDEAIAAYKRVLADNESQFGSESPAVAQCCLNLGALLYRCERYDEAEPFTRRVLTICESTASEQPADHAINLRNLADVLIKLQRYDEAEVLLRDAVSVGKEGFGEDHLEQAHTLFILASTIWEPDALDEVEDLLDQALSIQEAQNITNDPEVCSRLRELAEAKIQNGKVQEAASLLERALPIAEVCLGKHDAEVSELLSDLGRAQLDAENGDGAEHSAKRALEIAESKQDKELICTRLNDLAAVYFHTDRPSLGEPLLKRALSLADSKHVEDQSLITRSLDNLVGTLLSLEKYRAAEPYARRAVKMRNVEDASMSWGMATALHQLVHLLDARGKHREAIKVLQQLDKLWAELYDNKDTDYAFEMLDIVPVLLAAGEFDLANEKVHKALAILELELGPDHESTLSARSELEKITEHRENRTARSIFWKSLNPFYARKSRR